jgi:hypothetical protein
MTETAEKKPVRAQRAKTSKTAGASKAAKSSAPEVRQTEMFPEAEAALNTAAVPDPKDCEAAFLSSLPKEPAASAASEAPQTPVKAAPSAGTLARTAASVVLGGAAVVLFAANAALLTVVYQERGTAQNLATVSVTEVLEDAEKKLLAGNLTGEALQKAARTVSERLDARLSELRAQCNCTLLTRSAVVKTDGSLPDYTGALKAVVGADVASHLADAAAPASPLESAGAASDSPGKAAPAPKPAKTLTPSAAQRLMPEA